jgi:endonuclease/exonuclease/phosphatase family metal-dependent hydrolase
MDAMAYAVVRRRPADPASCGVLDALAGPAGSADLDVMTFNLRYAHAVGPHPWASRRPVMRALLRVERPDLIGTQEGLAGQLRDIRADLGGSYDYVGTGREGGTRGEFTAIFYQATRLSPRQQGCYWLSDTPEVVGSNTWGGRCVRMVTWVRFVDQGTGREFYAVNTHLDHISEYARQRSAALIRDRVAAFDPALPTVLTGDFNGPADAGSAVYTTLVDRAGLVDTWTVAAHRGVEYGTCHNYGPATPGGRIDWILVTPDIVVAAAVVNTYHGGTGGFASDHFPVQARIRLPGGHPPATPP